jgi:putative PIN family toxin of toxin-antitoxin system
MKVLLDTNVIISAVTTRGLCADIFRTVLLHHELVTCSQVLREVRRILRTKFSVAEDAVAEYLALLQQDAILAEPAALPKLPIKDKDDITIIAAALAEKVDLMVTGDNELQQIRDISGLRILSPRAFWEELMAGQGNFSDDR